MQIFYSKANSFSNQWKMLFVLVILPFIVIKSKGAASSRRSLEKTKDESNQLLPKNEVNHIDNVSKQTDNIKLSNSYWIIDDNQYNLASFGQCKGEWPSSHPLPLPLWSNNTKDPLIFQNVNSFLVFCFCF